MKLYNGDCLEVMKSIPDKSIDAIITDPPYGTTACKWDSVIDFDLMWEQLNRIIKPNGAIVLFGSEPFSSALRMSNIKYYKYDWIWQKSRKGGIFHTKQRPLKEHENIVVFSQRPCAYAGEKETMKYNPLMTLKNKETKKNKGSKLSGHIAEKNGSFKTTAKSSNDYNGKFAYPTSILKIKNEGKTKHPTQKPVALMEYLIKTYTNEFDTVLDFTMGSGTTGVACCNTNRDFIGIELDKHYFKIAQERIKNEL